MLSNDGERQGPKTNRKERKRRARAVSWVPTAKVGWTLPSPARHGGCKKTQPPHRLPSPWMDRERDRELLGMTHTQKNHRPGERREKRDAGSKWLQKDQKQNRQQKRADHAVDDAELAARRGSRFILERDNPPVKPEMKA